MDTKLASSILFLITLTFTVGNLQAKTVTSAELGAFYESQDYHRTHVALVRDNLIAKATTELIDKAMKEIIPLLDKK